MTHLPPEKLAIILGVFMLAASLLAPLIFVKAPKKMIFIISGSLASLSLATGAKRRAIMYMPTLIFYALYSQLPSLTTL